MIKNAHITVYYFEVYNTNDLGVRLPIFTQPCYTQFIAFDSSYNTIIQLRDVDKDKHCCCRNWETSLMLILASLQQQVTTHVINLNAPYSYWYCHLLPNI